MHDETQDPRPHVVIHAASATKRPQLSIWFFCGILLLAYGIVLSAQGVLDLSDVPQTVLANLHPTLKWGLFMTICGAFYTVRFRPRKA